MSLFHYAFTVKDISSTMAFYEGVMGCKMGRSSDTWIDFDLFGHQLSAHLGKGDTGLKAMSIVDGVSVPIPHFGCILSIPDFRLLSQRLVAKQMEFLVKPTVRYEGEVGEQWSMFFTDYSGNALEFKAFKNQNEIFQS